ncbi:MAG: hypothetical protein PVH21_09615 [Myxococcales bacterium]|jgi:hypothetical protein
MLWTIIAAAIVGSLAPLIRSWLWGVPVGLLSLGTVIRSFLGAALTVLVIGTVAFFVLRTMPLEPLAVEAGAAGIGSALGLLLQWSSARRMREMRGLVILLRRLEEEDARTAALGSLRRLLERVRRKNPERHIALVLLCIGPLTQVGCWEEARAWLRDLEDEVLAEPQAVLRNQALAMCELQFDDLDAAQRAIDRIARPTEESIEIWLVATEALLLALRGDSEGALDRLGTQETSDNPSLEASHRLVRAHVLAARRDEEAAMAELRVLHQEAGSAGLGRVIRPRGPASSLAERLLLDPDQSG